VNTNVIEQEDTLKADLEAAIEKTPEKDPVGDVRREERVKADATAEQLREQAKAEVADTPVDQPDTAAAPQASAPSAPRSWSAAVREHWSAVPPEVQAFIAKRENEIARTLQAATEHRRIAERFHQVVAPYQPIIQAEGRRDPFEAVDGLLKTVAVLQVGTPQQKATRMANLVSHYGIDIQLLDHALAGTAPQQSAELKQVEEMLNQRLAPVDNLLQRVNHAEQRREQALNQSIDAELDQFRGTNPEFFEDVRLQMADLMDLYAARNQPLSLADAYKLACQIDPQVSQVVAKRGAGNVSLAMSGNGGHPVPTSVQRKKNAASSVISPPGGAPVNSGEKTLREEIAEQLARAGT
jgi:hypothetical protein